MILRGAARLQRHFLLSPGEQQQENGREGTGAPQQAVQARAGPGVEPMPPLTQTQGPGASEVCDRNTGAAEAAPPHSATVAAQKSLTEAMRKTLDEATRRGQEVQVQIKKLAAQGEYAAAAALKARLQQDEAAAGQQFVHDRLGELVEQEDYESAATLKTWWQ